MFWIASFMCLFMVYGISGWLTKLMVNAGHSLSFALSLSPANQVGVFVGAIGGGWLADKLHIKYVVMALFALGVPSIALLRLRCSTASSLLSC